MLLSVAKYSLIVIIAIVAAWLLVVANSTTGNIDIPNPSPSASVTR